MNTHGLILQQCLMQWPQWKKKDLCVTLPALRWKHQILRPRIHTYKKLRFLFARYMGTSKHKQEPPFYVAQKKINILMHRHVRFPAKGKILRTFVEFRQVFVPHLEVCVFSRKQPSPRALQRKIAHRKIRLLGKLQNIKRGHFVSKRDEIILPKNSSVSRESFWNKTSFALFSFKNSKIYRLSLLRNQNSCMQSDNTHIHAVEEKNNSSLHQDLGIGVARLVQMSGMNEDAQGISCF